MDCGELVSAPSMNCVIAGRAWDISLTGRLSSANSVKNVLLQEALFLPRGTATIVPCRLKSLCLTLGLSIGCVAGTMTREHYTGTFVNCTNIGHRHSLSDTTPAFQGLLAKLAFSVGLEPE